MTEWVKINYHALHLCFTLPLCAKHFLSKANHDVSTPFIHSLTHQSAIGSLLNFLSPSYFLNTNCRRFYSIIIVSLCYHGVLDDMASYLTCPFLYTATDLNQTINIPQFNRFNLMSLISSKNFHLVGWWVFIPNPVGVDCCSLFTLVCCSWMSAVQPLLSWPVFNLCKVGAFVSHEGRKRKSRFRESKLIKSWPFSNKLAVYGNPRMVKLSLSINSFSPLYKGDPYVTEAPLCM